MKLQGVFLTGTPLKALNAEKVLGNVLFLSDQSPIIGCISLRICSQWSETDPIKITNSLTDSCLVDMIDMTLACEDAYSKLVKVVTVADVSDEDRVGNSLLQIWKLRFGHKA